MGTFTKGEVVLFPFPFTDLSSRKLRPCLVLSEEMKRDILLCQITSQSITADKYAVELKHHQTKKGSLKIDSYIRSNMLFTASVNQITGRVCTIQKKTYHQVIENIKKLIEN